MAFAYLGFNQCNRCGRKLDTGEHEYCSSCEIKIKDNVIKELQERITELEQQLMYKDEIRLYLEGISFVDALGYKDKETEDGKEIFRMKPKECENVALGLLEIVEDYYQNKEE